MRWTNDKPKQKGWYWYRMFKQLEGKPMWIESAIPEDRELIGMWSDEPIQPPIDTETTCTCHERDSSYCCEYCHSQGCFGHMEDHLKSEWQLEHGTEE